MNNISVSRILSRQARSLESLLKRVDSQQATVASALHKVKDALAAAGDSLSTEKAAAPAAAKSKTAAPAKSKTAAPAAKETYQERRDRRNARKEKSKATDLTVKKSAPAKESSGKKAAVAVPAKKKSSDVAAPAAAKKSSGLKKSSKPSGLKKAPVAAR